MNIEDIENMLHNYELDFIYPDKLDNSIIEKFIFTTYSDFKVLKIKHMKLNINMKILII